MRRTDEKQLLFLFLAIGFLLLGIIVWNLRYQSRPSADLLNEARYKFRERLPALLIKVEPNLQFQQILSSGNDLPDLVFFNRGSRSFDITADRIEQVLRFHFAIAGQIRRNNVLMYGLQFHGEPMGRVVVQGTDSTMFDQAVVGIIIDDFGYVKNGLVSEFMELGRAITISIIPGLPYSTEIAEMAASRGVEPMIHMPMEPEEYTAQAEDQFILLQDMSSREIINRLSRAFQEIPNAVGLNNHQGSLFTQNPNLMQTVLHMLRDRGMYFVDSYTSPRSIGDELASRLGLIHGRRTVFLDNQEDSTYIHQQLGELVNHAEQNGVAIGIGHARHKTLEVLQREIPLYETQGVRFARISEVVRRPGNSRYTLTDSDGNTGYAR
ncbi:MAG TPA: divergent polysaccharide deacetylase family protein [bacterium]|nr:divergent polysaccharide deacetylase family protein [bacterium]